MKPVINNTDFGSVTVNNTYYDHDIIIDLKGRIDKRKKKLSKAIYGTSHTISKDEAEYVYQEGAVLLIIGAGQYSVVKLSKEAKDYLNQKKCRVILEPTSKAVETWNNSKESKAIGLFHVTC